MKWEMVKFNNLIENPISGEWGEEGNSVRVIRTTNFTNEGRLNLTDVVFRNIDLKKIQLKKLLPGDTIIEKSGGGPSQPVGRVVYFAIEDETFLCNNFTAIIRPKKEVLPRFLFWFLFANHANKNTLNYQNKTTGILNLQLSRYLQRLLIPLPPLPTQRAIAARLDRADALRQKDRQLLRAYDDLAQSVFVEMFGREEIYPERFPSASLFETAEIVSGVAKNEKAVEKDFIEVPYMRVANVQDGLIDLNEVKSIKVSSRDFEKYQLKSGDILLTEGGDADKLGRGAIWHGEINPCIHQNHIFRVRLSTEKITPTYLSWHISSAYGKRYFLKAAKQTTGIASINLTQLKNFLVYIPPVSLQTRFATILANIEQQKEIVRKQQAESEALFGRLLQEAFGG